MRKLIVYILFIILFHSHAHCMDQKPQETILPEEIGRLIIFHTLHDTHIHPPTSLQAQAHLRFISAINKYLHSLANDPCMIRAIISNLSDNHSQGLCAQIIATPGGKNYVQLSNALFDFNKMLQLYNEKTSEVPKQNYTRRYIIF